MKQHFFITAGNSNADLNSVSCALLTAAKQQGLNCLGLKPIATGCELQADKFQSQQALNLMAAASIKLDYSQVNPITLAGKNSPFIASEAEGISLTASRISGIMRGSLMRRYDLAIVEGIGGWREPISKRENLSDLAKQLNMPVIVVINLNEEGINEAMLTAEAIRNDGLNIAGWVACPAEEEQFESERIYLQNKFPAPFLGNVNEPFDISRLIPTI